MHHTDAKEMAKLGVNLIIGEKSNIHHTDAKEIIKIVVEQKSQITIEKDYHHTDIKEMIKIGGKQITIKI